MRVVLRPASLGPMNTPPANSAEASAAPGVTTATVPPSKSMAHRLLLCAALAEGTSRIANLAHSADIDATASATRLMGAETEWTERTALVRGCAPGIRRPEEPVDCRESGSTLRFLIPLFSLAKGPVTFTGAPRLFERPLGPYEDIFKKQGLFFERRENSLRIEGPLAGGDYRLPGNISSQFISGLLFALPMLAEDSTITIEPPFESWGYVSLTRSAQARFNITSAWTGPLTLLVPGRQHYRPATAAVEGDWSQGAVFVAMAAAMGGFAIQGLDPETPQGDKAVLDVVRAAGAGTHFEGKTLTVAPPAGGLVSPGEVDLANCPDLGPALCAFAALCRGTTRFVNAGRLRIKESDRIAAMEQELTEMGVAIHSTTDTITIEGGRPLKEHAVVRAHNDHRVVMATAALAFCAGTALTIEGAEAVDKSWPTFFEDLAALGADIQLIQDA